MPLVTPGTLYRILEQANFRIVGGTALESAEARLTEVPSALTPPVRELLNQKWPKGLYSHQAEALTEACSGHDICLSTSTASGKSLVFMGAAADALQRDSERKVLAIYPARALIQDQDSKWKAMLTPLGFKSSIIDGGVQVDQRLGRLKESHVILMTPDVLHAWLMSNLNDRDVIGFVRQLQLLILDEAHVYEGVFGTNMAYLLRRLRGVSPRFRLICSTATIGGPNDFIQVLTGRDVVVLGPERDGSHRPSKTILLARPGPGVDKFQATTALLKGLAALGETFLAFADSRRMVEQIVASANRQGDPDGDDPKSDKDWRILPYRAGYEEEDRKSIQQSLEQGALSGVVSTSALELGLDIGDINLLVLLDTPPSAKAFWQRVGRAGRRDEAYCIFIDAKGLVESTKDGLKSYLSKPLEQNYLYLENRYIQYTNALCAAAELQAAGYVDSKGVLEGFFSVPSTFRDLLRNEINPTAAVPSDLYPLKQRAQNGPHREFPVRTGMEKNFEVEWNELGQVQRMGSLTFGQAIREAYPGAIYYYMARPYRVCVFDYKRGKIRVKRDRRYTTKPQSQAIVFPRFQSLLREFRADGGFLSEVEVQVSERVTGFVERRGPNQIPNQYGAGSPYYQFPLNRLLDTSGVCWYFPDTTTISEAVGSAIAEAFCLHCGVQSRDVGVGRFHAQQTPLGTGPLQGICVFDSTHGSLRLTEKLAVTFIEVVEVALQVIRREDYVSNTIDGLERLLAFAHDLKPSSQGSAPMVSAPEGWITVVSTGELAIYDSQDGAVEVKVEGYWPGSSGMMYRLHHTKEGQWLVPLHFIRPISDATRLVLLQPSTGEVRSFDEDLRAKSATQP